MKKAEKILISLAGIGIISKAFLYPHGATILVSSLFALAFIYLFFTWKLIQNEEENGKKYIAMSILSGVILAFGMIGVITKFQATPQQNSILSISLFGITFFILVISSAYNREGRLTSFYKQLLIRLGCWGIIFITFLFIEKPTLVAFFKRDDPQFVQKFEKYYNQPDNPETQAEFKNYLEQKNN